MSVRVLHLGGCVGGEYREINAWSTSALPSQVRHSKTLPRDRTAWAEDLRNVFRGTSLDEGRMAPAEFRFDTYRLERVGVFGHWFPVYVLAGLDPRTRDDLMFQALALPRELMESQLR